MFQGQEIDDIVKTKDGESVFSYEKLSSIRSAEMKNAESLHITPQIGGQENMLSIDVDILIGGGSRGGSKGQPYGSKVVTPFGFRRIGDLKVGSIISGTDGCMQKVICVTELGNVPFYKVIFSDGTYTNCTHDHLWKIKRTNRISKKRKLNGLEQDADWELVTFDQLKSYLDNQSIRLGRKGNYTSNNIVIPLCEPIKFTRAFSSHKKIDPYVLGALLGDGCLSEHIRNGYVTLINPDKQIAKEFEKVGIDMSKVANSKDKCPTYFIHDDGINNFIHKEGLYGHLANSKFIPESYKLSTVEERWSLVQGLMDTDGTIDSRGHSSYTTVSKTLAEDLAFVLRSLGAYVTISKGEAGYKMDGIYHQCQDAYTLYIKIKNSSSLFRLNRKKARCMQFNGGVSTPTKRIVGYEFAGYEKCRCIAVSNPNALYMTDDFIVTHNSFSLLLESLKDVSSKRFNAILFRKEVDDLQNLIDESNNIYSQFGTYNKSKTDMTWNLNNGGSVKFNYYSDNYDDFKVRFQGKQFSYIGIDEITHIAYNKFKYLITCNRNAYGLRNRFWGTCNPDPDSWVAKFIDWWIGEDGFPIPERDGKVRYCFMDGDDVGTIYWGDTREEVYDQCKETIDKYWKNEYNEYGTPQELFIKSVAFVEAKLSDNKKLLQSDPTYLANLANQSEEQRARDLDGNWKFKSVGDDLIKISNMEKFFSNDMQIGDRKRRASCDVAFDGGDNLVLYLWIGNHIQDIFTCSKNSKIVLQLVKNKLEEWGVLEEDFTYDLSGIGQSFKGFFPYAIPFNNRESVDDKYKGQYDNIKSQCAYMFYHNLNDGEISINPNLLDMKFSGKGFKNMPLRDVLMKERKAIKQDINNTDKGFCLIKKILMKQLVGHSPDFIEAMLMRYIFNIKHKRKHITGLGWL